MGLQGLPRCAPLDSTLGGRGRLKRVRPPPRLQPLRLAALIARGPVAEEAPAAEPPLAPLVVSEVLLLLALSFLFFS